MKRFQQIYFQYLLLHIKQPYYIKLYKPSLMLCELKINPSTIQTVQFNFTFRETASKLTVEASTPNKSLYYIGEILPQPKKQFYEIKSLIYNGPLEITLEKISLLRISVAGISFEMHLKPYPIIKGIEAQLSEALKRQKQLEKLLKTHQQRLNDKQLQIFALYKQIDNLKTQNESKISQIKSQPKQKNSKGKQKEIPTEDINVKEDENGQKYQTTPITFIQWSPELKSENIQIQKNFVRKLNKSEKIQFALLEESFSNDLKSVKAWAFMNHAKANGVMIGICLKSAVEKANFIDKNVNFSQMGHGFYLIFSQGFSFNQSSVPHNALSTSFNFKQTDVITVRYDPINWKLLFLKNHGSKQYQMPIQPPPEGDEYHPCVALFQKDSSIELIYPIEGKKKASA